MRMFIKYSLCFLLLALQSCILMEIFPVYYPVTQENNFRNNDSVWVDADFKSSHLWPRLYRITFRNLVKIDSGHATIDLNKIKMLKNGKAVSSENFGIRIPRENDYGMRSCPELTIDSIAYFEVYCDLYLRKKDNITLIYRDFPHQGDSVVTKFSYIPNMSSLENEGPVFGIENERIKEFLCGK